jgi:alkylation response protein AidB-like acyl-CoA dehydrogenase
MVPREQRWQALRDCAIRLAQVFEARSVQRYEDGKFPMDNIGNLREAGLTAINVPTCLGGFEASLKENVEIIRLISKGCGSTGFTLCIHLILTGALRTVVKDPLRQRIYDAVNDGGFVCGPFTDAGSGGNWMYSSTRASRAEDGYRLNGVKHFFSGYEACTHIVTTAALDDPALEPPMNLVAFFTPKPPSLDEHFVKYWDGFALPMTGSHSIAFRDLPVRREDLIGDEGVSGLLAFAQQHWGHYCFSAVFLGLAERAFEVAVETTRGRTNTAVKSPLSMMPGIQFALGKCRAVLAVMEALLEDYCESHAAVGDDLFDFVAHTCIPKYFIANTAHTVVQLAFDVIGGSGVKDSSRIGQIYRDVRAGPLIPFTNDLCLECIGKQGLGISLLERPRWG